MVSNITLDGDLVVMADHGWGLTLNGAISGAGGLTATGNGLGGILVLGGVNTYTGPTVVSSDILELAAAGQISADSAITNNATFQINGGVHALGAIGGTGAMNVLSAADVAAQSVVQGTLTIEPGAKLALAAVSGGGAAPVPEPAGGWLLLAGLVGWAGWRRARAARRGDRIK